MNFLSYCSVFFFFQAEDGIRDVAVTGVQTCAPSDLFAHGARLPDPDKLFNASLEGNVWRAIDLFEGDKINARALKNLVRAAVDYNQIKLKSKAPVGTRVKVHKSKK